MTKKEALEIVLAAADRRALEILNQASDYELKFNSPQTAKETMDEHYRPLRAAIDKLTPA